MMFLFWLVFLLVILAYSLRTTEGIGPTPKSTVKPVTWEYMKKSDYYSGANISTYGDIDLVDCKKICAKNSSCVGIVRPVNVADDQDGQCILKKVLGNRSESRYTNTYIIKR